MNQAAKAPSLAVNRVNTANIPTPSAAAQTKPPPAWPPMGVTRARNNSAALTVRARATGSKAKVAVDSRPKAAAMAMVSV